jgi:GT2 family glycosyltransferase
MRVLITILSFNSYKEVEALKNSLLQQTFDAGEFDVLIIDSSTDKKIRDQLLKLEQVILKFIPNEEFTHGGTRQMAIDYALENQYDYAVFVVQDAVPCTNEWLTEIIEPFKLDEQVACVFGKHVPYPHHNPLAKVWVELCFENISPDDTIRWHTSDSNEVGKNYNSNVNAAYNLRYFNEPLHFERINYSEDQKIAQRILDYNLIKIYAPKASVFHSHNLEAPFSQFQRYYDDFMGLKMTLGTTGQSTTLLEITKKAKREYEANSNHIFKNEDLNWIQKMTWKRKARYMAYYKYVALYLAINQKSYPPVEVYKYISRDGMRKYLNLDKLNLLQRMKAQAIILRQILEFGKIGFKKGLNENKPLLNTMVSQSANGVTAHENGNVITPSIYPLPYFYNFVLYFDKNSAFKEGKIERGKKLVINWIIPDLSQGSGGHLNIFRVIKGLESFGHKIRLYIMPILNSINIDERKELINKHYVELDADVLILNAEVEDSDICIATSWITAYPLYKINNTKKKIYFIQDYESKFYPTGAESVFAENTYKMNFKAITAGPWLKQVIEGKYHMKAGSFELSYSPEIYYRNEAIYRQPRKIIFYARHVTPRRGFEIGILALKLVKQHITDVHIVFVGWDCEGINIPFVYENRGMLTFPELAAAYNEATVGLVISLTNYSLLPQEMIACGLTVVDIRGENTEAAYSDGQVIMAENDPFDIAKKIIFILQNPEFSEQHKEKAFQAIKDNTIDRQNEIINDLLYTL